MADLVLGGPIARDAIPDVCERARALLERCVADPVVCDVGALDPDAVTVDAWRGCSSPLGGSGAASSSSARVRS